MNGRETQCAKLGIDTKQLGYSVATEIAWKIRYSSEKKYQFCIAFYDENSKVQLLQILKPNSFTHSNPSITISRKIPLVEAIYGRIWQKNGHRMVFYKPL